MFQWLSSMFKPASDKVEETLLELFDFLISDYGFEYKKEMLGDAIDKGGKFFFCGPLNAYQFYNENVCIHILHLVQRDDYDVYITDKKSVDQVYIRNGIEVPSRFAYHFPLLAREVKESVLNCGKVFGHSI